MREKLDKFLEANRERNKDLTPLQEAARKALFFKIFGPNVTHWLQHGRFLLGEIDAVLPDEKDSYQAQSYDKANLFITSNALENLTGAEGFSMSDLIKIYPDVVNQKYAWTDCRGGAPRNYFFSSALDLAVMNSSIADVITLVENGAEINPTLLCGESSPLNSAKSQKQHAQKGQRWDEFREQGDIIHYLNTKLRQVKIASSPNLNETPSAPLEVLEESEPSAPLSYIHTGSSDLSEEYNPHEKAEIPIARTFEPVVESRASTSSSSEEMTGKISGDEIENKGDANSYSKKGGNAVSSRVTKGLAKYVSSYDVKIDLRLEDLANVDEESRKEVFGRLLYKASKSELQQAFLMCKDSNNKDYKIIQWDISSLLSNGADPNYIDPESKSRSTPLLNLVKNSDGRMENIISLVEAGADVNHVNNKGESVLHEAIRCPMKKNSDIPIYLLSKGANPSRRLDESSVSDLYHAVYMVRALGPNKEEFSNLAVSLIENGAKLSEEFHQSGLGGGNISALSLLNTLEKTDAQKLIRAAIRNGQNIDENSPALAAFLYGETEAKKIVVKEKADFEKIKQLTSDWPTKPTHSLTTIRQGRPNSSKTSSSVSLKDGVEKLSPVQSEEMENLTVVEAQPIAEIVEILPSAKVSWADSMIHASAPEMVVEAITNQTSFNPDPSLEKKSGNRAKTTLSKVGVNDDMTPSAPPLPDEQLHNLPPVPSHEIKTSESPTQDVKKADAKKVSSSKDKSLIPN